MSRAIYYSIRNCPNATEALATARHPLLAHDRARHGYRIVAEKFETGDGFGPICIRRFVENTHILGERIPEQWQQAAFGQADG
jgi:hypothetical protein